MLSLYIIDMQFLSRLAGWNQIRTSFLGLMVTDHKEIQYGQCVSKGADGLDRPRRKGFYPYTTGTYIFLYRWPPRESFFVEQM